MAMSEPYIVNEQTGQGYWRIDDARIQPRPANAIVLFRGTREAAERHCAEMNRQAGIGLWGEGQLSAAAVDAHLAMGGSEPD